ncbi:hypothetical protein J3459_011080 [Metarhizium acridum]|uniref:Uncharacterized protein n=2 Tax=Metarhizium acridum TaxID=92637 RepID=E9E986_METAQ|nr:uncharacterized protein MAC_06434 [Metarhizium acridum CQMa 102]EFY87457.1 hypothetical protein MAC_06434 [Metarhizium acridum CQMa 102]KAG8415222.1 hypothetical protein J3458_009087 [Metarhizium acridum]KAG8420430.1 hypothetical protein J3459_011080 [Metarhizium acridum]
MDFDIEMGDAAQVTQDLPAEELPLADDILGTAEPQEPGELVEDESANQDENERKTLIPNKLHIRGVDTLHTDDIKAYIKSHFGPVDKIEWIDDSSANLVFVNELTARDAIMALSAIEVVDVTVLPPGETLPAKSFDGKPEISLHVRFAVTTDKKQAGAALRSRYYLLHPEHDPEERRRRYKENRPRYRERDDDYRRSAGRRRRDSDDDVETFEASMYDDIPRSSRSQRDSAPAANLRSYAEENRGKELFMKKSTRRDRSASPRRDRDGDAQMDDMDGSSHRNRAQARSIKNRIVADNSSKELFPTRASGRGGQLDQLEDSIGSARLEDQDLPKIVDISDAQSGNSINIRGLANQRADDRAGFSIKGAAATSARELFPDKLGASNAGKELLDPARSKRRQRAEDLFS